MGIRRSYHFNTVTAGRLDGIYVNDPCDIHFRQFGVYTPAPYGIDSDASARLQLGDRVGSRPNSASFPIEIQGGFHEHVNSINTTPYNVTVDDLVILVDSTGGNLVLNLPAISTVPNKILNIYKSVRANSVILTPNGGDTIDGFTGTQFSWANPNYAVRLVADSGANVWRRLMQSAQGIYLGHEYSVNPTVTINSGTFQSVRSYSNVALSNRDFAVLMSGSGWYNNNEFARIEFALFVDGVQGPLLSWWNNSSSQNHIQYTGTGLLFNAVGLHTVEIRARRISGSNNFTMDANDFFNLDLIQY